MIIIIRRNYKKIRTNTFSNKLSTSTTDSVYCWMWSVEWMFNRSMSKVTSMMSKYERNDLAGGLVLLIKTNKYKKYLFEHPTDCSSFV